MRKCQSQRSMPLVCRVKNDFTILVLLLAWTVAIACAPAAFAQKKPTMKPDLGPLRRSPGRGNGKSLGRAPTFDVHVKGYRQRLWSLF